MKVMTLKWIANMSPDQEQLRENQQIYKKGQ